MSTREPPPPLDATPDSNDGASSFEVLYERLEAVAQRLGTGGLSLEESVGFYEEGMRLAARCERLLDVVEQRVETLRHALAKGASSIDESDALDAPPAGEPPFFEQPALDEPLPDEPPR